MDVAKELQEILEQNGIYISEEWDEELDFDSITFISIIVCIETQLGIEVPDDYLLFDKFKTFTMYIENITKIKAGII